MLAQQKINNLKKHHFYKLACYLAVPISFTPIMAYCIWDRFRLKHGSQWFHVSDVMMSRICKEVGFEIFEIGLQERELLLNDLSNEDLRECANYVFNLPIDSNYFEEMEANRWVVQSYFEPAKALENIMNLYQNPDNHFRIQSIKDCFLPEFREKLSFLHHTL